ncbi:hypothetical protein [Nocardioides stalactiti]|uniref:hypothetical protein n=1 Tax=Nocardioides stalactiti TaxID=2755356 RepID=UPI0015FFA2F3|nr:hypothetical protein [Nocardioides stalactiti]
MNRILASLLAALIVLVAINSVLVWRADERAREDAERQTCIEKAQATAIIGLMIPTLLTSDDEVDRDSQIQSLGAIGTQLDAC